MIPDKQSLPDRDFSFKQDHLKWLEAEITRYRDIEWQVTSFHTAVFIAILYLILDPDNLHLVYDIRILLLFGTGAYAVIAVSQLIYVHWSLNRRRNDRNKILEELCQLPEGPIRLLGFWEGWGAIFPIGFILSIVFLEVILFWVIWQIR